MPMGLEDILLLLGLLIIFAAVLFIAWLTTKLLGRKMAGASKNKFMRIVETLPIGMDRCLYLVKAGDQFFLFYATRKNMQLVSEIKIDEEALAVHDEAAGNSNGFEFRRIFDFYSGLGKRGKQSESKDVGSKLQQEPSDQHQAGGLSENIQKLRRLNENEDHNSR